MRLQGDTLIGEAANGRTQRAIQAMRLEGELRIDGQARADRFVAEWQARTRQLKQCERNHDHAGAERAKSDLRERAWSLQRDPLLESLLKDRRLELGFKPREGASLSHEIQSWLDRSRSRGLGL